MPKYYFTDPGLRNLAIGRLSPEPRMVDRGQLLEGMVASFLVNDLRQTRKVHYWRTRSGAEVDFIVADPGPVLSVEVKHSTMDRIRVSRGYRSFLEKYSPPRALLLSQSLWAKERIAGSDLQALPVAVFLGARGY